MRENNILIAPISASFVIFLGPLTFLSCFLIPGLETQQPNIFTILQNAALKSLAVFDERK